MSEIEKDTSPDEKQPVANVKRPPGRPKSVNILSPTDPEMWIGISRICNKRPEFSKDPNKKEKWDNFYRAVTGNVTYDEAADIRFKTGVMRLAKIIGEFDDKKTCNFISFAISSQIKRNGLYVKTDQQAESMIRDDPFAALLVEMAKAANHTRFDKLNSIIYKKYKFFIHGKFSYEETKSLLSEKAGKLLLQEKNENKNYNLFSFMYTSLKHFAIDAFCKGRGREIELMIGATADISQFHNMAAPEAGSVKVNSFVVKRLKELIEGLATENSKKVMITHLKLLSDGMSATMEEVAEASGLPEGTVKSAYKNQIKPYFKKFPVFVELMKESLEKGEAWFDAVHNPEKAGGYHVSGTQEYKIEAKKKSTERIRDKHNTQGKEEVRDR